MLTQTALCEICLVRTQATALAATEAGSDGGAALSAAGAESPPITAGGNNGGKAKRAKTIE